MSRHARDLALLAALALLLRLPLLLLLHGAPFDMESYARAAACGGPGLYASPALDGRYPYLPLWWLLLRAASALGGACGGDPGLWLRLPAVAGDLAVSVLACIMAGRGAAGEAGGWNRRAGLAAGLAWALNPLAALLSAGHGQFDGLALALLLGAALCLQAPRRQGAAGWAALCFAGAVALKTWPLALLPVFLAGLETARTRWRFALAALGAPLLLLAPWLWTDGAAAVASHLAYSGANALGLSAALKAAFFVAGAPAAWILADRCYRALALALLASAFVCALLGRRRLSLPRSLPFAALTMVLLAPGLSPQYLLWAPALALAVSPALAWRLSLAALPLAALFYALFMPGVLAGAAAWAPPQPGTALILGFAAANLAWWCWTALEWRRLAPFGAATGDGPEPKGSAA